MNMIQTALPEGLLLVNKPRGKTSFSLVSRLRKHLGVQKIGHCGTLDPFATGLMIMLIGRTYTRMSDHFLGQEKEYLATIRLGETTDTYDCDGAVISRSEQTPSLEALKKQLAHFQGEIEQVPPMFSAKKIFGKKLYELARQGIEVARSPVKVSLQTTLLEYAYPFVKIQVQCSKGTYIRSIAFDLGQQLGCGGHLVDLARIRCGTMHQEQSIDGQILFNQQVEKQWLCNYLMQI